MRVGEVGRGVIGDFRKNILQNDFQGKNICTEQKKKLMAYNAGKKTYTVI